MPGLEGLVNPRVGVFREGFHPPWDSGVDQFQDPPSQAASTPRSITGDLKIRFTVGWLARNERGYNIRKPTTVYPTFVAFNGILAD